MEKTVVELFAGVGGFRIALNEVELKDNIAFEKKNFSFLWANQWEPSTKSQHAFDCYKTRFQSSATELSNVDIAQVDKTLIPEHSLLCGGFPCQDYSVARSLSKEKGIEGKKGVLWWQINEILKIKRPPFVLLENVDRLIKSPSKQRGRDFGIMLRCLNDLGYAVEWRVINAADYGFPQKRRRVYIFAYHNSTQLFRNLTTKKPDVLLGSDGVFAQTFLVEKTLSLKHISIVDSYKDLISISDNFQADFFESGIMFLGHIYTAKQLPQYENPLTLRDIVLTKTVPEEYFLSKDKIEKFAYLRGSKKIKRKDSSGFEYIYSEGAMSPYDNLDEPGRTMLTSEGSINRSTHIILDPETSRVRLLTPVECERLNQFPDNWTETGMPKSKRYFMMGNALVCGIITKLGKTLSAIIDNE